MPLDNQIIVPKYFSGNYTETVLTPQQISAVALTGNQTVSGTKTFASRPTVNGTGILLSGEASSLPNTVVYTTGNQTITGLKSFSDVSVTNKITLRNVETSWGGLGSGVYFSQPNNSATQIIDYIDTNLSITRGNVQSIYNAALENAWNGSGPSGTRWNKSGYDDLGNVASRTYDSLLNTFNGAIGSNIVGSPLVMHDTINNKYYKILFNNWQQGGVAAGTYAGFSYTRWLIVNPTYPYPTVSGEKLNFKNKTEFDIRPIVNGTGVLLSGEVVAQLPNTIVYNTGNQTISGAKTFVTGIVAPNLVYNTGNQTISGDKTFNDGILFKKGNMPIGYITGRFNEFLEANYLTLGVYPANGNEGYISLDYLGNGLTIGEGGVGLLNNTAGATYISSTTNNALFLQHPTIYINSTQTVFNSRPTVNSSGVLLEGEIPTLPNTIVYTTGNQTVSGIKTFASRLTVNGTGVLLNGEAYPSNNPSGFLTGVNLSSYATISNLATTGSTLQSSVNTLTNNLATTGSTLSTNLATTGSTLTTQINNLSGTLTGNYATISNLVLTGLNLDSKINNLSGVSVLTYGNQTIDGIKTFRNNVYINNLYVTGTETIVNTPQINIASNYLLLNLTGGAVDGGIFFVTGTNGTGINEYGPIIGFDHSDKFKFGIGRRSEDLSLLNDIAAVQDITNYSGFVNNKYATILNLGSTGQNLQQQINNINSSGFITNQNVVYTTGNQTISGLKVFGSRPTVNGTGVLLSGEAAGSANFRYFPASGVVNLLSNNRYSFDTLTSLVTGVLPSNPQKGDEIELYDSAGAWHVNPLIINNNGNYIEQKKEMLECNVRHGLIKLIYTTQNNIGWRIYPMPIHNVPLFLPPIPAIYTSSISGFAPLTLSFTGVNLQTPAESSPVDHWYWNVSGDAVPEFDQRVITYTFNETGNYTFYLTAVNVGGSGLASGTFSILEVPPVPPAPTGADPYPDYVTLLLHFNP